MMNEHLFSSGFSFVVLGYFGPPKHQTQRTVNFKYGLFVWSCFADPYFFFGAQQKTPPVYTANNRESWILWMNPGI